MAFLPPELDFETFVELIDRLYDEILIYDNNYKLLYVNRACERHYGFTREEMLSMPFHDAVNQYKAWSNSVLPLVYRHKCAVKQQQETYLGYHTLLVAEPVFGADGELRYVIMSNRDQYGEIRIPSSRDLEYAQGSCCFLTDEGSFQGPRSETVRDLALKMARVTVPCLLLGESGTGKTFLAKYIHLHSPRAQKPFVVVSCPSIPRELIESELFGHVKGAFSGAVAGHEGLFSQAQGGTLLLDEISELPPAMQAKLLHVLQEKEFRPVGASRVVAADVRVLAASNRDLERMVEHGLFRQDLFFRLNVFDITLPPLRERGEEIEYFIHHFLGRYNRAYGKTLDISDAAMDLLRRYRWPGNIRELKNMVERMAILAEEGSIEPCHLPPSFFNAAGTGPTSAPEAAAHPVPRRSVAVDKDLLLAVYQQHKSSRKVAQALGISQSTASRLIRRYITAKDS